MEFGNENDIGVQDIRSSDIVPHSYDMTALQLELLPNDLIDNIIFVPDAVALLDPRVRRSIASEKFITDRAFFPVAYSYSDRVIWSTREGGRVWPLCSGFIPFANVVGGLITAKGGRAGEPYATGFEVARQITGFLTLKEVLAEIQFILPLIQAGYRASLPFAYIVINEGRMKDWLRDRFSDTEMSEKVFGNLAKITRTGERAVIQFRVTGINTRLGRLIEPLPGTYDSGDKEGRHRNRQINCLAQVACLLGTEAQICVDHFHKAYLGGGAIYNQVLGVLDLIMRRKQLDLQDVGIFLNIIYGIAVSNAVAIAKAMKERPEYLEKYSSYQLVQGLVLDNDTDVSFFAHDFDFTELAGADRWEVEEDSIDYFVQIYLGKMGKMINRFIENWLFWVLKQEQRPEFRGYLIDDKLGDKLIQEFRCRKE